MFTLDWVSVVERTVRESFIQEGSVPSFIDWTVRDHGAVRDVEIAAARWTIERYRAGKPRIQNHGCTFVGGTVDIAR